MYTVHTCMHEHITSAIFVIIYAHLAVNSDAVVVIAPFLGLEVNGDIQAESWDEAAPLFRVLDGEEWGSRGNNMHLLIVSRCIDDLLCMYNSITCKYMALYK